MESLPTTISELQHLTNLQLTSYKNLKELPQSIANILPLSMLDLSSCNSMESLPTTIGELQHLTKLQLTSCKNLKELPQSIASLSFIINLAFI
jgi:Leucine-rich repeat (LRR) protein